MKWKNKFRIVGNGLFHILILLLIILSFSLNWGINNYGNINLDNAIGAYVPFSQNDVG